jgi:acetoin utilization deacetylase AcuC-like enzyme
MHNSGNGCAARLFSRLIGVERQRRASVLTLSIHQDRCYPIDSGGLSVTGVGRAAGTNLNVPLPPGSGHEAYLAAFDRVVLPAKPR